MKLRTHKIKKNKHPQKKKKTEKKNRKKRTEKKRTEKKVRLAEHSIRVVKMSQEDSVNVVARFRPFNSREKGIGNTDESEHVFTFSKDSVTVDGGGHVPLKFDLNYVFNQDATQEEVYGGFGSQVIE